MLKKGLWAIRLPFLHPFPAHAQGELDNSTEIYMFLIWVQFDVKQGRFALESAQFDLKDVSFGSQSYAKMMPFY